MAGDSSDQSRMPLDIFTKSCPPGLAPNIRKYPLRKYNQLLQLWHMQTDVPPEKIGAAVVGRLKGPAFQYAMQLSDTRVSAVTGLQEATRAPAIFAELAYDQYTDVNGVIHPAKPSGAAFVLASLNAEFKAILKIFNGSHCQLSWTYFAALKASKNSLQSMTLLGLTRLKMVAL